MEGRFPPGIRAVYTRCANPAQLRSFNEWYDRVHVPDILASGLTRRGFRYRNSETQESKPDYLSVWELETDVLEPVNDSFGRMAGRLGGSATSSMSPTAGSSAPWKRAADTVADHTILWRRPPVARVSAGARVLCSSSEPWPESRPRNHRIDSHTRADWVRGVANHQRCPSGSRTPYSRCP